MSSLEVDFRWVGQSLDRAFAELEAECAEVIRGLSVEVWNKTLERTPQFYGRMAASWSYSLNAPQFYDRSRQVPQPAVKRDDNGYWIMGGGPPYKKGHPDAIAIANADNIGSDAPFKLGDTIWIANGVDHGEGYYSGLVESGGVNLRWVNRPGAAATRTVDQVGRKYEANISPRVAERLKALKIGSGHAG